MLTTPLTSTPSIDRPSLIKWLLLAWFIVSLLAFLFIGWHFLNQTVYRAGLQSGASNASAQIYSDIITKATNENCNTVFVQYGGRRVDLVNILCLQPGTPSQTTDLNSDQIPPETRTDNFNDNQG